MKLIVKINNKIIRSIYSFFVKKVNQPLFYKLVEIPFWTSTLRPLPTGYCIMINYTNIDQLFHVGNGQIKENDNDQESIQSSSTPNRGHHMGK